MTGAPPLDLASPWAPPMSQIADEKGGFRRLQILFAAVPLQNIADHRVSDALLEHLRLPGPALNDVPDPGPADSVLLSQRGVALAPGLVTGPNLVCDLLRDLGPAQVRSDPLAGLGPLPSRGDSGLGKDLRPLAVALVSAPGLRVVGPAEAVGVDLFAASRHRAGSSAKTAETAWKSMFADGISGYDPRGSSNTEASRDCLVPGELTRRRRPQWA